MSLLYKIDKTSIPSHIAIIMDGNGRWAKARGLERSEGHKEGVNSVRKVVEAATKSGVKYLTIYAFSTENWNRPAEEVYALMNLMVYAISKETPDLIKNGVKIIAIGDVNRLPENTLNALRKCEQDTAGCGNLTLLLALSYSSKWEISNALRLIAKDICDNKINVENIDENLVSNYLTTKNIPNPDLLIRTGGEKRISNFLLWQTAYSEFYFTDTFWPDFREEQLYEAIMEYQNRERRFGKTSEQIQSES